MEISSKKIIGLIGILLFVTAACSFSASTAKIEDAVLVHDFNGGTEETTVFAPDEIFYCLVTLANAPDDTVVKAIWYAVNAEGIEPDLMIDETEFSGGDEMTFNLSYDGLWPAGTYKVELYLNNELDRTLEFSVQ